MGKLNLTSERRVAAASVHAVVGSWRLRDQAAARETRQARLTS